MEYHSEIFFRDGTSKLLGVMHSSIKEAQNEAARYLHANGIDPVQHVQIKKLYKGGRSGVHANYRYVDFYNTCDATGHLVVQGGYFRKIK